MVCGLGVCGMGVCGVWFVVCGVNGVGVCGVGVMIAVRPLGPNLRNIIFVKRSQTGRYITGCNRDVATSPQDSNNVKMRLYNSLRL